MKSNRPVSQGERQRGNDRVYVSQYARRSTDLRRVGKVSRSKRPRARPRGRRPSSGRRIIPTFVAGGIEDARPTNFCLASRIFEWIRSRSFFRRFRGLAVCSRSVEFLRVILPIISRNNVHGDTRAGYTRIYVASARIVKIIACGDETRMPARASQRRLMNIFIPST